MRAQADLAGMDEPVATDGIEKLATITKTSKCNTAYKNENAELTSMRKNQ